MQRGSNSIEEEMIVKAIQEEASWEKLPKRLKIFLASSEEYHRRVKEYCIKKRFKWSECAARSICRESEYYEDLVGYLRKNLALFPYHLSENVCRIQRLPPFRYYCDMLFEVMKNERPYDSIPNFSAADALRLTGIGRNEFIDIMNKCRAKKLMWKLNKNIARDMLPTIPVDFPIEPWWTVCAVNLTVEEYRKIPEDEMVVVEKLGRDDGTIVAEVDLDVVRALYKRGLIYLDVPIYPDDHFQVSNLDGFVSNRDQSHEDPTEELLYAVFVASSERATVGELAHTLQADSSQLEAAVSLAARLGWAKKVLDPSSLLADFLVPGSPLSEDSIGDDEGFRMNNSTPSSPFQEGLSEADGGGVVRSPAGITRFALMVDANLTSYLMIGSLSQGLKGHAVTLYEAGKLLDSSVVEMCEDLRQVEGTKFEGELQQLADHAFSLRHALECLRAGGRSLTAADTPDSDQFMESSEKSGPDLIDFQLEPSLPIPLGSDPHRSRLSSFRTTDQFASSPELAGDLKADEADEMKFAALRTDEHERSASVSLSSDFTQVPISSVPSDVQGRPRARSKRLVRKHRVDILRIESLQDLSQGTIHRVLQRDYDVVVSMIPLLSPPSVVSADGSGPVHFGPPSRAAITPWMKLLLYSVSGSGPISVALIRGQRLRLLPPPLAGCAKALVWAWDGIGIGGVGGKVDGTLVEGGILLHCLNSLLKYTAVLVQPFPGSHLDENGSVSTRNVPLPLTAGRVSAASDDIFDIENVSDRFVPDASLLGAADDLSLGPAGYIRMIRVRRIPNAAKNTLTESKWEWVPQSVEFGFPLFDTELCKMVCDGVSRSDAFRSNATLSKHHVDMQKLRRKLRDFISDHQANGPISRLAYPGGQFKSKDRPLLLSQASAKWNPSTGIFDPVRSPISRILSPSRVDFLKVQNDIRDIYSFDGEVPMSPLPLPPILGAGQQSSSAQMPTILESPMQKTEYVDDDVGSDVPLPGLNLIFDGASLSPLNIALFLQGRLPLVLVAEAAAASEAIMTKA